MVERSLRGKVAIVGIGETTYYKHGQSPEPEFKLALMAILAELPGTSCRTTTGGASLAAPAERTRS